MGRGPLTIRFYEKCLDFELVYEHRTLSFYGLLRDTYGLIGEDVVFFNVCYPVTVAGNDRQSEPVPGYNILQLKELMNAG